jgi:peptidylprolyl isomerase
MRKILLCLALLLTACGNGDGDDPESAIATPTEDATAGVQECEDRTPSAPAKEETLDGEPEVEVPDGAPPCKLVIQDIKEGTGAEATEGATVSVQYVGVSWSTREQFESSWGGPEPATFALSGVIAGWEQGIPGMKVGGRRQLIIPPDLAYGPEGQGSIAPNETLVFVIDLLDVQ